MASTKPARKKQAAAASKQAAKPKPQTYTKRSRAAVRSAVVATILPPAVPHPPLNTYSDQLGQELADMVAMGIHIGKIALMERTPSELIMWKWIADDQHPFSKLYKLAKKIRNAKIEEKIEQIAEEPETVELVTERTETETKKTEDGKVEVVHARTTREVRRVDNIKHRELKINVYKWSLGHTDAKKHGPKPDAGGSTGSEALRQLIGEFQEQNRILKEQGDTDDS